MTTNGVSQTAWSRLPHISARSTKSGPPPEPVVGVHSLAHATAAMSAETRAGRAVVLASAPGAGSYVGPGWFRELVATAREAVPDAGCSSLLDCGDDAGATLAALRSQVEGVVFIG